MALAQAVALDLPEDVVTGAVEHLNVQDALAVAAVCTHWRPAARADCVWILLCRGRWKFGALFGAPEGAVVAPGEREELEVASWRAAEASRGRPAGGAFDFFKARSRQDSEVRRRLARVAEGTRPQEHREQHRAVWNLGANALDVLCRVEEGPESRLRKLAQTWRQELSDRWAVEEWGRLLAQPDAASCLEEGALVLSQWAQPAADVAAMRQQLDRLAGRAAELGCTRSSPSSRKPLPEEARAMIQGLNGALFEEFGLAGNTDNYYSADNSFLHAVLERRRGIPISLCIVWAAVARRRGLACHLLAGFPRHLLIRVPVRAEGAVEGEGGVDAAREDLYVDAFDRGRVMNWEELIRFTANLTQHPEVTRGFEDAVRGFVELHPPEQVYLRLLRNLLSIYQREENLVRLLGVALQMRTLGATDPSLERLQLALEEVFGRERPASVQAVDGST